MQVKKNSFLCPIASRLSLTEKQFQIPCSLGSRVTWKSHMALDDKLDHQEPHAQQIPTPVLRGIYSHLWCCSQVNEPMTPLSTLNSGRRGKAHKVLSIPVSSDKWALFCFVFALEHSEIWETMVQKIAIWKLGETVPKQGSAAPCFVWPF